VPGRNGQKHHDQPQGLDRQKIPGRSPDEAGALCKLGHKAQKIPGRSPDEAGALCKLGHKACFSVLLVVFFINAILGRSPDVVGIAHSRSQGLSFQVS